MFSRDYFGLVLGFFAGDYFAADGDLLFLPPSSGGGTAVITPILTARLRKIER